MCKKTKPDCYIIGHRICNPQYGSIRKNHHFNPLSDTVLFNK